MFQHDPLEEAASFGLFGGLPKFFKNILSSANVHESGVFYEGSLISICSKTMLLQCLRFIFKGDGSPAISRPAVTRIGARTQHPSIT